MPVTDSPIYAHKHTAYLLYLLLFSVIMNQCWPQSLTPYGVTGPKWYIIAWWYAKVHTIILRKVGTNHGILLYAIHQVNPQMLLDFIGRNHITIQHEFMFENVNHTLYILQLLQSCSQTTVPNWKPIPPALLHLCMYTSKPYKLYDNLE